MTLELEDHLFVNLALRAHELDVTLNEYMNILLHDALKDEVVREGDNVIQHG